MKDGERKEDSAVHHEKKTSKCMYVGRCIQLTACSSHHNRQQRCVLAAAAGGHYSAAAASIRPAEGTTTAAVGK